MREWWPIVMIDLFLALNELSRIWDVSQLQKCSICLTHKDKIEKDADVRDHGPQ